MIDTFGWDLVYATTLASYDSALQASGRIPASFNIQGAAGQYGSWHIVAGAPSNRQQLQIDILQGSAQVNDQQVEISGAVLTAVIQLAVTADGTIAPLVGDSIQLAGYRLPSAVPQADYYAVAALLEQLLHADVPKLAGAFGAITITPGDRRAWLAPTSALFASQPLPDGDPRGAVFAILAMSEGRDGSGLQQAVDARIFDGAPAGADRGLAVGPARVTAELLLPGAVALVQGSQQSDFQVSSTGTISNAASMTWGQFTFIGSDGSRSQIAPTIPAGNLQLTLNGANLHISMSNIHFAYPGWSGPGDITVAFDAEQFAPIGIFQRTNGQLVIGQAGEGTRSFSVTVIPSEKTQIFQIALNAALEVLFAFIGGALDSATAAAENAASVSIEDGAENSLVSSFSEEDVEGLLDGNATEEELEAAEADASEDAGNAAVNADNPGLVQSFRSALMANRYKILLKIIEKTVEVPASNIVAIAVALAKSDYDSLPSLDPFLAATSSPVTWADGSDAAFIAGQIDGALLLWARPSASIAKVSPELKP